MGSLILSRRRYLAVAWIEIEITYGDIEVIDSRYLAVAWIEIVTPSLT